MGEVSLVKQRLSDHRVSEQTDGQVDSSVIYGQYSRRRILDLVETGRFAASTALMYKLPSL